MKKITQSEIVMEYFKNYPLRDIKHPEIVDWVTQEYKKRTGEIFRDPGQGDTIEEARNNLKEALELFFETASSQEIDTRLHSNIAVK
jgi:hypothetical protein